MMLKGQFLMNCGEGWTISSPLHLSPSLDWPSKHDRLSPKAVDPGDLSLLDPVRARGEVWRKVSCD